MDIDIDKYNTIVFDLDGTLSYPKERISSSICHLLTDLLRKHQVAIISGASFAQLRFQVVDPLIEFSNFDLTLYNFLHLMPTSGASYYRFYPSTGWQEVYSHHLTECDKLRSCYFIEYCSRRLGFWQECTWGNKIEDRGSQITYSALGQNAPLELKKSWDPTGCKRRHLVHEISHFLTRLKVTSGGTTSIDVTDHYLDKAYGLSCLEKHIGCTRQNTIFFGDKIEKGGNDEPVYKAGWKCIRVLDYVHTEEILKKCLTAIA